MGIEQSWNTRQQYDMRLSWFVQLYEEIPGSLIHWFIGSLNHQFVDPWTIHGFTGSLGTCSLASLVH